MATMIAGTGTALLAGGRQPDACATTHHDCDKTTTIRSCCCDSAADASREGGPVEARVQVSADTSAVPVVLAAATLSDATHLSVRVHTSPPRSAPPDLPTLFASLLI